MALYALEYANIRRNRSTGIYTALLVAVALLHGFGGAMFFLIGNSPETSTPGGDWIFDVMAATNAIIVLLTILTLALRTFGSSNLRLSWTKYFNIFLLFAVPLGTVAGAYGLRRIDKYSPLKWDLPATF